jgi:hypothetical protein
MLVMSTNVPYSKKTPPILITSKGVQEGSYKKKKEEH